MESYLPISFLNDFIFCPRSIYNHQLYKNFNSFTYKGASQLKGTAAHATIDDQTYSHANFWLISLDVFSQELNLCGKIDLYNKRTQTLRERKRSITTIYDGYYFQVYAQYFCLKEMGYEVKKIELYDLSKNKTYTVVLPEKNQELLTKFYNTLENIKNFDFDQPFKAAKIKCKACIYSHLCDKSLC
tara:strand:+ start:376 stop:933 length:558 start_codon:yes stop_codon:yes gene_type:complete